MLQNLIFNPAKAVFALAIGFSTLVYSQSRNLSGNYSSEGDIAAKGIMTMEINQSGSKISGISTYKSYDDLLDTGMLSVNGYMKGNTGFIRFRDQRGNTVADGSIKLQDVSTLVFKQSSNSDSVPKLAYLYTNEYSKPNVDVVPKPVQNHSKSYAGKYSSEGDVTAKGTLSFDISQTGAKIEGIANYLTYDGQLNSGMLSVNGYVKNGVAYVRFRDQKGNAIADGAMQYEGNNVVFKQTTLSDLVPHYSVLYR